MLNRLLIVCSAIGTDHRCLYGSIHTDQYSTVPYSTKVLYHTRTKEKDRYLLSFQTGQKLKPFPNTERTRIIKKGIKPYQTTNGKSRQTNKPTLPTDHQLTHSITTKTTIYLMPSIKGTASIASNAAQTKLLRSTKFPSSFASPVDLTKVNATVMAQWIEKKIESILGFEDEIVSSMAINLFFPKLNEDFGSASSSGPVSSIKYAPVDPRKSQLDLVGFLGEEDAARFSCELWEMLIDAQNQPRGIPKKLIEEKKKELAAAAAAATAGTATKATNASTLSPDRRGRRDERSVLFHGRRRHPSGSNSTSHYGQNTTHDIRPSSQMHPELGRPKRTTTSTSHAAVIERSDATGGGPSAPSNYESQGGQYYDSSKDRFRGEYYSNKDYDSYPDRFRRRSFAGGSSSRDGGGEPVRERDWRSHYPSGGYRSSSSRYDETYHSDHSSADSYGRRRRYGEPSSSRSSHRRWRSDRYYYDDDDDDRRRRRRRKSRSLSRSRSKERYQGRDGSHEYNRKRSSRSRSKSPNNNKYSSNGRSFRR